MAYHRIDELEHLLPPDIQTPSLHCGSADSTAVFSAAFPVDALEDSEKFSRLAEGLEGVDQIIAPFRTSSVIHAELYRDQALAAGINPSTVRLLLQDRFRRYQIGLGSNPAGDTLTLSPALLSDNIPLPAEMHSLLHFSPGEKRNSRIERVDGVPQQVVTIFADPGKNIIGLCARLEQYAGSFPSASIMFNRGRYLSNVLSATFIAVALGVAAVILCLSLQTGGFTAAMFALLGGLPLSLGTSLVVLKACGLGLHMMSLAGIAAASGLLIDTAVVFFEHCNSDSYRQMLHGAARPITVATATTLVVCIPVLLLPYGSIPCSRSSIFRRPSHSRSTRCGLPERRSQSPCLRQYSYGRSEHQQYRHTASAAAD
ncbi:MAG: efflux RND transporter permease subunit [Spirochaetota bacterium]|nr:efflux RND transporter permease subunit [Spirochaetota bacterium]